LKGLIGSSHVLKEMKRVKLKKVSGTMDLPEKRGRQWPVLKETKRVKY